MPVEFDRGSPGKFDSRTLSRKTLNRWTGRNGMSLQAAAIKTRCPGASALVKTGRHLPMSFLLVCGLAYVIIIGRLEMTRFIGFIGYQPYWWLIAVRHWRHGGAAATTRPK